MGKLQKRERLNTKEIARLPRNYHYNHFIKLIKYKPNIIIKFNL